MNFRVAHTLGALALLLITGRAAADLFPAGQWSWATALGTSPSVIQSLSVDQSDNIVAAGAFTGPLSLGTNHFTAAGRIPILLKLTPSGEVAWARSFPDPFDNPTFDPQASVSPGPGNSLYWAVTRRRINAAEALTSVRRYDQDGQLLWSVAVSSYDPDSFLGKNVSQVGIHAENDGGVLAVFNSDGAIRFGGGLTVSNQASLRGAFAARFRADGSLAWAAPATNTGARITAFCTDNAGGYWLTGPVPTPSPFGPQPAMAHYNAQGQLLTAVIAEGAYPPVSSSILSIPGEISLMAPLPEGGVVAVIPSTVWQDVSSGLPWEPRNYQLAGYQYRSVATFNPRGFQEVITWTEKIYSDYPDQFTALAVDSLSRIHFSGQFAGKAWVELSSYQGLDPLSSDSARLATYFASYDTDGALLGVRQASTSDLAVHDTNRVSVITAACLAVDSENNLVAAGSYTGQAELDGFSLPAGPSPDSSRAFIAKLGRSPAIVTAPADAVAFPGQRAQFSVTASGPAPLSYQWLHDGVPLPGKTGSTMVIPAIKAGDAGHYSVRVSSPWGSAESAAATLTLGVEGALIQLIRGVSVTGTIGSTYTIQASLDGIQDWRVVGHVILSTSPQQWVDETGAAGIARFLKAVPGL